ncbi:ArsR/SmtB family transcription factor [Falsiroseomonas ponticola]|uniref:ArsR/SmtB family transcription factor n=1 Tax=Falsiroseomonas ponticola TaxID=2786951 RepID=UPI0019313C99|nr:metalloregulator ArsR/SmtB family transcription factor [Roseomonas ponticola]
METTEAIEALAALAQETRLLVFRRLVVAGAEGLPAGEIARLLSVPPNTLSTHLAVLSRAGLVTARRQGRSVIYAAAMPGIDALIDFLLRDCCGGRAELCGALTSRRPSHDRAA